MEKVQEQLPDQRLFTSVRKGQVTQNTELIIEYLKDKDIPCPRCQYNLRNLQGRVCPECGEKLLLRIGLEEPRTAAYISMIVGQSLGLGYSLPLTLILLIHGEIEEVVQRFGGLMLIVILTVTLFTVPGCLFFKSSFRRLPQDRQTLISILATVIILIMTALSVLYIN